MLRMIDLFAGVCGFSLAAHQTRQIETVAFVEKDKYCQKTIKKNFPNVPIYDDIRTYNPEPDSADIVCGGFPCQPASHAGLRAGTTDDRWLWPEMRRVIQRTRPTWVFGENVTGLLSLGEPATQTELVSAETATWLEDSILAGILDDLKQDGYTVRVFHIPAEAVWAPHERYRIWIVAYYTGGNDGQSKPQQEKRCTPEPGESTEPGTDTYTGSWRRHQAHGTEYVCCGKLDADGTGEPHPYPIGQGQKRCRCQAHGQTGCAATAQLPDAWDEPWLQAATRLCGMDDGLPHWMDKRQRLALKRLVRDYGAEAVEEETGLDLSRLDAWNRAQIKAMGNSIVPKIALEFFKGMVSSSNICNKCRTTTFKTQCGKCAGHSPF